MLQVTLRTTDNLPENFVQNQFCIGGPGGADADLLAAVKVFYDVLDSVTMPAKIAQNGHIVKRYDLPGTPPNYPTFESTFNLGTAPTSDTLPSEAALCLSFEGERVPGEFQARKRGRVFIGPLRSTTNNDGRPATATKTALLNAGEAFYDAVDAITDAGEWSVWSTVDQVAYPIVRCWVDDAFDTQRSRGVPVTSKEFRDLI